MKTRLFTLFLVCGLAACDKTPGVRTSQSAGGPGNAPSSERSPSPGATP